jgi:hypothetical protein
MSRQYMPTNSREHLPGARAGVAGVDGGQHGQERQQQGQRSPQAGGKARRQGDAHGAIVDAGGHCLIALVTDGEVSPASGLGLRSCRQADDGVAQTDCDMFRQVHAARTSTV